MLYLLDASVLITANNSYYPVDSVPEFWEWLLHMGKEGHIKIPLENFEEIKEGPANREKDLLYDWIQNIDVTDAILFNESVNAALVQEAIIKGYAPDLTDTELEQLGRDPFLVAYAMVAPAERTVVTSEVSKPSKIRQNRRLPDVCTSLDITPRDPFYLNRVLGFKTNWNK
ncbi:MAG TPA: DUF4411 family protein [Nitrospira sp.]|nr:DUF4411 family protein [Nitrospira sp.]